MTTMMPTLARDLQRYVRLDPTLISNPYPLFRELRERDPILWSGQIEGWIVTGYDEVVALLRATAVSSARHGYGRSSVPVRHQDEVRPLLEHLSAMMGTMDPPSHMRVRSLANKAFTPRAVEQMRDQIRSIVDELLDRAVPREELDVVADLSYPLPIRVISQMMAVPASDQGLVKRWSDDFIRFVAAGRPGLHVARQAQQSLAAMSAYFAPLIEERRSSPRADLLSSFVAAGDHDDRLSDLELMAMCNSVFTGGHETTTNLIANGVLALLGFPDQLRSFADGSVSAESAVEELLRFDSSVQRLERFAREDIELGSTTIRSGQRIWLMIGAANRDPRMFKDPDVVDLTRSPNRHLSFAHGVHYCIGAPLARVEAQLAFGALLSRTSDLRLAAPIEWQPMLAHRGPVAVRIQFKPGR
jgi:cytochrome P450